MIKRGDIIVIKGKGYREVVLEYILNKFKDKLMINISNKGNKIAITDTIDKTAQQIINNLINENLDNKKLLPIEKIKNKIIKPLYLFTDEEVLLYAKLNGLKFKKEINKKNKIIDFLEDTEKKHPEVKRAVVNSYLKLYNQ